MVSDLIIKIRVFLISNMLILLIIPILTFLLIFITYGNEIHEYLIKYPDMYRLYELTTIKKTVSQSAIPSHIKCLAIDMVIYSYVLFSMCLILFAYSSYFLLSRKRHNSILIIMEFTTLVLIYYFIAIPGMPFFIKLLVWLFFSSVGIMISVYLLFYKIIKK